MGFKTEDEAKAFAYGFDHASKQDQLCHAFRIAPNLVVVMIEWLVTDPGSPGVQDFPKPLDLVVWGRQSQQTHVASKKTFRS